MDRLAIHHGRRAPGFKGTVCTRRARGPRCQSWTVWPSVDGRKCQVLATIILYTKVVITGWYSPLSASRLLLELAAGHGPSLQIPLTCTGQTSSGAVERRGSHCLMDSDAAWLVLSLWGRSKAGSARTVHDSRPRSTPLQPSPEWRSQTLVCCRFGGRRVGHHGLLRIRFARR